MVLRNVVPRQGTETRMTIYHTLDLRMIEKCSSPTGDGNKSNNLLAECQQLIEKCSSPTGDGNKT